MRAWKIYSPGSPDEFRMEEVETPRAAPGQVLIQVRAFGLNRSEWFTRRGDSPSVKFPRVLGIECVGVVVDAPGGEFKKGERVAAIMGGMGREFDGSYAEFTCVPVACVLPIESELDWETLGALPEMLQTCNGSLDVGLGVKPGETLLIRGGTSSIGLTTMAIARSRGVKVATTTRNPAKKDQLLDLGASHVFVEGGQISPAVCEIYPGGVDRVLELIGASTLLDSLRCARVGGVVCMTGILGGKWELDGFQPMGDIPTGVRLSSYSGGSNDISREQFNKYVRLVERGELRVERGPTFGFEQLIEAHRVMDENRANGKMVVLVSTDP